MMLLGISGLGDYAACNAACQANYDTTSDAFYNCNSDCVEADAATANAGNPTSSSGAPAGNPSWWSTALTSLVKGATQGLVTPGGVCPPGSTGTYPACSCLPGSPGTYPTCLTAPTPFYETPIGIIAILGVLGAAAYFLAK